MTLSPRQVELLKALINRIIPKDDDPDGWEAGVGDYLFRQFEGDLSHVAPVYALGLDALEAEALALYNIRFDRLPPAIQDELLARIEMGKVTALWAVAPAAFFRMAVDHCAEGFYADPGNGGNHGGVSWAMIGFEVRG